MSAVDIHSDEFEIAVARACDLARQSAFRAGQSVIYIDASGRYVQEHPDGRRFEVRLDPTKPREAHRVVIREIICHAA